MKILVSIPNTGWIHKHVCFATDALLHDLRVTLIRPTHRPYENNLAHIRNQMLEQDFDWWLNIDADNPPMRNPLELIQLDKALVGLPTPVYHWTGQAGERLIYWNVYRAVSEKGAYTEWLPREGLQKVDAIGTGCFLVRRDVVRCVAIQPFLRTYNSDGTVCKGNDIAWCERVRKAGFDIWAHFDYPCRHFVELELNEVVQAFKGMGIE